MKLDPTREALKRPPAKLKVFAPNGETKEVVAYLGVRGHNKIPPYPIELCLLHDGGKVEVLSKKVVVQNLETGKVCYNPRIIIHTICAGFLTESDMLWLRKNPCWPAMLELEDNPVEN